MKTGFTSARSTNRHDAATKASHDFPMSLKPVLGFRPLNLSHCQPAAKMRPAHLSANEAFFGTNAEYRNDVSACRSQSDAPRGLPAPPPERRTSAAVSRQTLQSHRRSASPTPADQAARRSG